MYRVSLRPAAYLGIRVELLKLIDDLSPRFTLRKKRDSFLMKVLSYLWSRFGTFGSYYFYFSCFLFRAREGLGWNSELIE